MSAKTRLQKGLLFAAASAGNGYMLMDHATSVNCIAPVITAIQTAVRHRKATLQPPPLGIQGSGWSTQKRLWYDKTKGDRP